LPLLLAVPSFAEESTIKIGILHSLSGTMAISETVLKDTVLMLIRDQNAKGGLLGRKLEPIIADPASDWPLFAEKARDLLANRSVAVVFGCWTSASRKSVLPVFEELNGLLYYPVQYEGEESSRNIFYTGAAPNQQAIPAVQFLMSKEGGETRRWVMLGTDYVYPRTTNRILQAYLANQGTSPEDILTIYTPFGFSDWREIVEKIKTFASAGKKTAVVLTIISGLPLARMSDTGSRKRIMGWGLAAWSLLTGITGLTWNYVAFFAARLLVGVGEASYAPAATSMIGDMFPPEKRSKAMAVFMLGLPIGLVLAFFSVGEIIKYFGSWRAPFFVATVPGLALALFIFFIKEPARGAAEKTEVGKHAIERPIRTVIRVQTVWWVSLAGVFLTKRPSAE
jgi:hypothetical protein